MPLLSRNWISVIAPAWCSKLKFLPTNINMESLYHLDLSHCTQLKTFPEISTRIGYLDLENTGIEEVPSSIRSWPDFAKLSMRGCKSLRMFPDVLDSMEELNWVIPNKFVWSRNGGVWDLNGFKNHCWRIICKVVVTFYFNNVFLFPSFKRHLLLCHDQHHCQDRL